MVVENGSDKLKKANAKYAKVPKIYYTKIK
jgi:hypothetical protein